MELPYTPSDIETPDKVYHRFGLYVMLVLVVVVLIGAMQSGTLFAVSLLALAAVGAAVALEVPLRARRLARAEAAELSLWPPGTRVVCRVAQGDPRTRPTKDVTTLTLGDVGISFYDPGTALVEGPAWFAAWSDIIHLSLKRIPDQPLTGVLEIETAEVTSYLAVYEWAALSAYLRQRVGAEAPW